MGAERPSTPSLVHALTLTHTRTHSHANTRTTGPNLSCIRSIGPGDHTTYFTGLRGRELYDVYLKTSRHTYDIGIIVDLTPVSDGPHASMQSGRCEYVLGFSRFMDVVGHEAVVAGVALVKLLTV